MALPTSIILSGLNKEELDNELDEIFDKGAKLLKSPSNETPTPTEDSQKKLIFSFEPADLKKIFSPKNLSAYFDLLTGATIALQGDESSDKDSKEKPLSKENKEFNDKAPSISLSIEWPPLPPINKAPTPIAPIKRKTPTPIKAISNQISLPIPISAPSALSASFSSDEVFLPTSPSKFSFPTPASTARFNSELKDSIKIIYNGKNILDLAANIKWSDWKLKPVRDSNSCRPSIIMPNDSSVIEQYKTASSQQRETDKWSLILTGANTPTYCTKICQDCGFEDPLTYY